MSGTYALHKRIGLIVGIVACLVVLALPTPEGMSVPAHRAGAMAILMSIWWISEALPLVATSLIPLAVFPLLGIINATDVAHSYGHRNIFLFAGGFFVTMSMRKWNLQERIALNIIIRTGTNPNQLVLGFMIATAFLSMWISNTATTMMMVPIALAVIAEVNHDESPASSNFSIAVLLGIAYSASIGGMGTLIGTPPNLVLASQFNELFKDAPAIGFMQWMLVGVPLVLVFLPLTWFLLTRFLYPLHGIKHVDASTQVRNRLGELGKMGRGEKIVSVVAISLALSWMFRADIDLGKFVIPGWAGLFPNPDYIHDGTVAMFFTVLLFAIPVDIKRGEFALDWEWAKRIPWNILLLFGGGLAVAKAFKETGLVGWIGQQLDVLGSLPVIVVILAIAFMMTFLTELTSNTATTTIMLPILAVTASAVLFVHPLLLMIPATISASCAFMLPVATPPNAIVFGSGRLTIGHMVRAGLVLNFVGILLVTALVYFVAIPVFDIDLTQLPTWAESLSM